MEVSNMKEIKSKQKMFNLINDYMKNNPQEKFLRKSIVKKAFLKSKRGDREKARNRLVRLRKSKYN